jgi:uncharacterized protein YlxP (DUF503 family)
VKVYVPAPDESIWVGVLRLALQVPGARSLKDRRAGVAHVKERLRARHEVSVAEVGHLESHERAVVAVCSVHSDPRALRSQLDGLRAEVESWGRVLVTSAHLTIERPGGASPSDDGSDGFDGAVPRWR